MVNLKELAPAEALVGAANFCHYNRCVFNSRDQVPPPA